MGNDLYVYLETTYPHKLLLCLKKMCTESKEVLSDKETFLNSFRESFPECRNEQQLMKFAYENDIVDSFFAADRKSDWEKRIVLRQSLKQLTKSMAEKYAVILVESLMFVFHWDFSVKVTRKWPVTEEEKAWYHDPTAEEREENDNEIWFPELMGEEQEEEQQPQPQPEPQQQKGKSSAPTEKTAPKRKASTSESGTYGRPEYANGSRPRYTKRSKVNVAERRMANYYEGYYPDDDRMMEPPYYEPRGIEPYVLYQKPEQVKFYQLMTSMMRKTLRRAFRGDVKSQCEVGDYYADKNSNHLDYKEAIRWYETAANGGYTRASFEIGRIYDMAGAEIPNGKEEALKIYEQLANQGYPTAQCVLGMKYRFGDGVKEDMKTAEKWLEKAALQGHTAAIRNLADLYHSTGAVNKARKWYEIGTGNGDGYCEKKYQMIVGKKNSGRK